MVSRSSKRGAAPGAHPHSELVVLRSTGFSDMEDGCDSSLRGVG